MTEWPTGGPAEPRGAHDLPGLRALAAAPRLAWPRALLLLGAFLLLWLAFQAVYGLALLALAGAVGAEAPLRAAGLRADAFDMTSGTGLALAAAALLATLTAVTALRRAGGLSLAAMGLRGGGATPGELALGAALGPVAFALVLAVESALGWAHVTRGALDARGLLVGALTFAAIAVGEEVFARGYVLQTIARAWGPMSAVVASSLLFAVLHGINPNATPLAIAALAVAGLVLAWGYLISGRLWLPIACHWSWNFAQGPLFGFPVSGLNSGSLLAIAPTGPEWITGGAFGPEAGLLGLGAELLVAGAMLLWWRAGGAWSFGLAVLIAAAGALGWLCYLLVAV